MLQNKENISRFTKFSLPEFDGENFEQYIDILYSHQKQCEKEAQYQEAEMAKKKLVQLKKEFQRHRREQIFFKHQGQKREVETAHAQEMVQFNSYWDEKMIEYQNEAQKLQDEVIERHEIQMREFESEVEKSIGYRHKESGELRNLRKIEQNLAKRQSYIEAHKVQKQIQEMEKVEYEKWTYMKANKIKNLLLQLTTKQENQISALRQRIEQGFEEQKKTRINQEEKLIKKYKNFMSELQNHHKQQVQKFEKSTKVQSKTNYSKSMSKTLQSIKRN